ncbi:rRNA biogenesis protein rrp36 [Coemansia sp. RSA 2703]|nr:rRNA biogenesis protein rrp36 [Coemansia sp. RSA 2703]
MPKKVVSKIEQYSSSEDESSDNSFSGSEDELSQDEGSIGGSDDENEDDDSSQTKAERIREQLANVPFDQLIRIQQQMGVKKFNRSIGLGDVKDSDTKRKVKEALRQRQGMSGGGVNGSDNGFSDSSDEDSGPEVVSQKNTPTDMHRDSKKMPAMMSSKRPVSRFRQVVQTDRPQTRDPRFDSLSGNYNEDLFEKSYSFLDKQRETEIEEMRKQANKLKNKDPEEAARIQLAIDSLQSQSAAKQQKKNTQELKRRHRAKEMEAVKQGKTPYFLKKRDLKTLEVAEKFNKLKDSSKLDGYLEKRRKRNATKDHRSMPYQRREQ